MMHHYIIASDYIECMNGEREREIEIQLMKAVFSSNTYLSVIVGFSIKSSVIPP